MRRLLADLDYLGCLAKIKGLLICIHADEFDTDNILFHHSVDSIVSAAADTNYYNFCSRFRTVFLHFNHGLGPPWIKSSFLILQFKHLIINQSVKIISQFIVFSA